MTDDTAARLRKLAEREARDRHDAAQWCASHSERDDRDEWAYVSLMDLRNAVDGATILALLDERDALRRERDEAQRDARELRFLWGQRGERANKAEGERDAAVALLRRRGRALVAIECIARNSETAIVLPDIARMAADALLGGGEG